MIDIMERHLGNLARSIGTEYTGNRYDYILNQNDLYKALSQSRSMDGYALRKESARQRYLIMNDVELERVIQNIFAESVNQAGNEITNIVASDTVDMITNMINGAIGGASGSKTAGKKFDLASELGKALVTNTFKTIEAIHRENQKV